MKKKKIPWTHKTLVDLKKKKKYLQPKSWELCFIWWEFLGLQAQETASQITLRELLQGRVGGASSQFI